MQNKILLLLKSNHYLFLYLFFYLYDYGVLDRGFAFPVCDSQQAHPLYPTGPYSEHVPPVFGLDGTDVSQWEKNVHSPAVKILTALRNVRE